MNPSTLNAIKAVLMTDESITANERTRILNVVQNGGTDKSSTANAAPRLVRRTEVARADAVLGAMMQTQHGGCSYARIKVRPKGAIETKFVDNLYNSRFAFSHDEPQFSDLEMQKNEWVVLIFCKSPISNAASDVATLGIKAQVVFVGTELSEGIGIRKEKPYVPNICFDLTFNNSNISNPNEVTFNELKYVQIEGLGRDEVQQPLEVLGGEITLVAGEWPKTFLIPSQTNQFWRVSSFETNGAYVPAGYGLLTNSYPKN
jgi:hypothetical protein